MAKCANYTQVTKQTFIPHLHDRTYTLNRKGKEREKKHLQQMVPLGICNEFEELNNLF